MAEPPSAERPSPPVTGRLRTPADIASLIARNITPIACLLFFATSPESLVALYAIDTMLSIYTLVWLVMEHITEAKSADRGVWRIFKLGFSALLLGTLVNVVLILPMGVVFESSSWLRTEPWLDANFRTAVYAQVVGSGYALVQAHRMLQQTDDDDHILGERFKFIIARWVVVLGAVFFGLATFFGAFIGSALIVVLYAGASIYFELFPEKAHQLFHGKPKPADAAASKKPRLP
jgi:hypothetical protein